MYRKMIHILTTHVFIVSTSIAAVVHSTVVLDVAFNGPETDFSTHPWEAIWRKLVAFFIALSLDIGQVVTSAELKNGKRSRSKLLTFFVLAASTYLLQFTYLVGHIPETILAPGVNPAWAGLVKFIVQCGTFLIPALLPGSTILYTFSNAVPDAELNLEKERTRLEFERDEAIRKARLDHEKVQSELEGQLNLMKLKAEEYERRMVEAPQKVKQLTAGTENLIQLDDGQIRAQCPGCQWSKDYSTVEKAISGLRSHKPYCKGIIIEIPQEVSS